MRSLAVLLLAGGCVFDGDLKHEGSTVPEPLDDGWEIATPESVGLSTQTLAAIHAELLREDAHVGTLGLLVVADGKLVWETYLRTPDDRDRRHPLRSATKSITSLVLGIVLDDLGGPTLDMRIDELFADEMAEMTGAKRDITLRHLLTMSSGIAFDNGAFSLEMVAHGGDDGLQHILDKPMDANPGERFSYRDADPQLIGYAIDRLTGEGEDTIARQRLFAPLGIEDVAWGQLHDGTATAAFGVALRPRDLAKLGQLVLDSGVWHGRRVVPAEWLAESTRGQIESDTLDHRGVPYPYGYYWWVVDGVGFTAWGHGGQFVLVVPERRMVLVQIGMPDADLHGSSLRDFYPLVAPLLQP